MIKIWLNYEISGSKMSLIEEFRHETNFDHYISKFVFFPVDLVFFFFFHLMTRLLHLIIVSLKMNFKVYGKLIIHRKIFISLTISQVRRKLIQVKEVFYYLC